MFQRLFSWGSGKASPDRAARRSKDVVRNAGHTYVDGTLPPICMFGLRSIERRSAHAHPMQIRRWIKEIRQQLDDMYLSDREFAEVLLLKLEHLIASR